MEHPHTRNPDGTGGTVEDNNDGTFLEAAYSALDDAGSHVDELVKLTDGVAKPNDDAEIVVHVGGALVALGRALVYAIADAGLTVAQP